MGMYVIFDGILLYVLVGDGWFGCICNGCGELVDGGLLVFGVDCIDVVLIV